MSSKDLQKGSFYWYDPTELMLVRNPDHPLYDKRVEDPPDPFLMASIQEHGVRQLVRVQPAKTYTDEKGKTHSNVNLVAEGRRRVRAAQELVRAHKTPVRVKVEYVKGTGEGPSFEDMVIGNAHRRPEEVPELARKCAIYRGWGHSEAECARLFGVDVPTIRNWLAVDSGPREVKAALANGQVNATVAYELARQDPSVATAVLSNGKKIKGEQGKAIVRAAKKAKPLPEGTAKRLGVKGLLALQDALTPVEGEPEDEGAEIALGVVEFILGVDPTAKRLAAFKASSVRRLVKKVRAE